MRRSMYMNRHAMQSAAAYRIFPESETKPENRATMQAAAGHPHTSIRRRGALSTALFTLCAAVALSACTSTQTVGSGPRLEPIPGSITYGGQPRTKLTKAPIGSMVPHQFFDTYGHRVYETYVINPDRSLRLTSRRIDYDIFSD
ncbi:hypothetical protein CN934_09340 [Ensifer sp. MMN_5]|nr:hypothetical protein CN934_09340 [Ensifer sp. MMN_5]PND29115.1 hypothetical protein CN933_03385 [Sinorhizobium sp. M4_45]